MKEATATQDNEKKGKVSAYLSTPKKKRKNFVIIASKEPTTAPLIQKIAGTIKRNHQHLAVSNPSTFEELKRQFGRNINLLIIEDTFADIDSMMKAIDELKSKSKKDPTPVLFLTNNPINLIEKYRENLLHQQEIDDFIDTTKWTLPMLVGRLKSAIENKNRRRSRRFKVRAAIEFFHLNSDSMYNAELTDLSMVGGLVRAKDLKSFRLQDQITLKIPSMGYLDVEDGEFLSISAKVRRVYVTGDLAGVEFCHVTESQSNKLTKYLMRIAREQLCNS